MYCYPYVDNLRDGEINYHEVPQGNRSKVAVTFTIPREHSALRNGACNINVKRYVKVSYFLLGQRFKCIVKK